MAAPVRTAAVLVAVYAIGQPGTVGLMVTTTGEAPNRLTPAEVVRTLRDAANLIDEKPELLR